MKSIALLIYIISITNAFTQDRNLYLEIIKIEIPVGHNISTELYELDTITLNLSGFGANDSTIEYYVANKIIEFERFKIVYSTVVDGEGDWVEFNSYVEFINYMDTLDFELSSKKEVTDDYGWSIPGVHTGQIKKIEYVFKKK